MKNTPYLLFDDQCTLCTRFVQVLKLINGYEDFNFIPLGEVRNYEQFEKVTFEELSKELHVYFNKEFHIGAQALEFLISRNPIIKKHLWLLDNQMAKKTVASFYKAANKARKSSLLCGGCL